MSRWCSAGRRAGGRAYPRCRHEPRRPRVATTGGAARGVTISLPGRGNSQAPPIICRVRSSRRDSPGAQARHPNQCRACAPESDCLVGHGRLVGSFPRTGRRRRAASAVWWSSLCSLCSWSVRRTPPGTRWRTACRPSRTPDRRSGRTRTRGCTRSHRRTPPGTRWRTACRPSRTPDRRSGRTRTPGCIRSHRRTRPGTRWRIACRPSRTPDRRSGRTRTPGCIRSRRRTPPGTRWRTVCRPSRTPARRSGRTRTRGCTRSRRRTAARHALAYVLAVRAGHRIEGLVARAHAVTSARVGARGQARVGVPLAVRAEHRLEGRCAAVGARVASTEAVAVLQVRANRPLADPDGMAPMAYVGLARLRPRRSGTRQDDKRSHRRNPQDPLASDCVHLKTSFVWHGSALLRWIELSALRVRIPLSRRRRQGVSAGMRTVPPRTAQRFQISRPRRHERTGASKCTEVHRVAESRPRRSASFTSSYQTIRPNPDWRSWAIGLWRPGARGGEHLRNCRSPKPKAHVSSSRNATRNPAP